MGLNEFDGYEQLLHLNASIAYICSLLHMLELYESKVFSLHGSGGLTAKKVYDNLILELTNKIC